MGSIIQTNTSSLITQNNLSRTSNRIGNNFERQASGFRINNASDDASGLIISNQLSAQIISQNAGIRNANDGISLAQVAEGALQEVTNNLLRSRELALQASSGQNSPEARAALNAEFQALGEEVSRIAGQTEFGGQNLLASSTSVDIQVGQNSSDSVTVETPDVSAVGSTVQGEDILTADNANAAIGVIDAQLAAVDAARTDLGASQNRLTSSITNSQNVNENAAASRSRIQDTDFASAASDLARDQVLQQANLSLAAQANISNLAALSLLS